MIEVIFKFRGPDGDTVYVYEGEDGSYVVERTVHGQDRPIFCGILASREMAVRTFNREVAEHTKRWEERL